MADPRGGGGGGLRGLKTLPSARPAMNKLINLRIINYMIDELKTKRLVNVSELISIRPKVCVSVCGGGGV